MKIKTSNKKLKSVPKKLNSGFKSEFPYVRFL